MHGHYESKKKKGKGGTVGKVLLILLAVIALGAAGAYLYLSSGQSGAPAVLRTQEQAEAAATSAPEETVTQPAETTQETTVETTEAIVYFNPLNGEILDEPYTGRIFASTISNIRDALPHVGVNDADILMEMYVNGSIIRCLALYTDVSQVEMFGSVRSTRLMFSDICQHYNAVLCHAGGSSTAKGDLAERGVDNVNLDIWVENNTFSVRDEDRNKELGWEHCLMGLGPGVAAYAESQGIATTQSADKDYCLRFTDDGTPEGGESATTVSLTLTYGESKKDTTMVYDEATGKYAYNQYDQVMVDGKTGETEAFRNVIIMQANITTSGIYHVADFVAGGTGYFACGGKIVPITWECDGESEPFRFRTQDGEVLELGRGNTYIAICTPESPVIYQ